MIEAHIIQKGAAAVSIRPPTDTEPQWRVAYRQTLNQLKWHEAKGKTMQDAWDACFGVVKVKAVVLDI
jgi:hypothetical protein